MNTLEISILSPAISTGATVGNYPNPTPLTRTWGEFLPVENYFPGVRFLRSSNVGSAPTKNSGISLPGTHGTFPVYSPVSETQREFEFLVRTPTGNNTKDLVENFVEWLYSLGEFRISFNGATRYMRMMYRNGNSYELLDGIYGNDANFVVNLSCIDSLLYDKEYTNVNYSINNYAQSYSRYANILEPDTLDFTPMIIEVSIPGISGLTYIAGYNFFSYDGKTIHTMSFRIPSPEISFTTDFKIVINSETAEFYLERGNTKISLIRYIDLSTKTNVNYVYKNTMFPTVMSKRTWFSYEMYSSNPRVNYYGTATIKYRKRKLAYE